MGQIWVQAAPEATRSGKLTGHASIESTRIYLHLADDWLAAQYRKAAEVIDAQVFAIQTAPAAMPRSQQ
jgi:hypothetical protein